MIGKNESNCLPKLLSIRSENGIPLSPFAHNSINSRPAQAGRESLHFVFVLQNVNVLLFKAYPSSFSDLINPLVLGVIVGDLYEGVPYHHVVILIGATFR